MPVKLNAPDYLLVDSKIKQDLLDSIQKYIREFYSAEPACPDYARIINQNILTVWLIFSKTVKLLLGKITELSVISLPQWLIMFRCQNQWWDEIFGPILPVIEYDDLTEAIDY